MAQNYCSNCGKRITNRTEVCPHCKAVLKQTNENAFAANDGAFSGNLKNILGVIVATLEAVALTKLLCLILSVICGNFIGTRTRMAFSIGSQAFQNKMFAILAVGLIALCILPFALRKLIKTELKTSVIFISVTLALVFGLYYALSSSAYSILSINSFYNMGGTEMVRYATSFYVVTMLLYQGMFCLLNQSIRRKCEYVLQAIFAGVALVLTVILVIIAVVPLGMGTLGAAAGGILASLIAFILVVARKS